MNAEGMVNQKAEIGFVWYVVNAIVGTGIASTIFVAMIYVAYYLCKGFGICNLDGTLAIPIQMLATGVMALVVGLITAKIYQITTGRSQLRLSVKDHINNILITWGLGFILMLIVVLVISILVIDPPFGIPTLKSSDPVLTVLTYISFPLVYFVLAMISCKRTESVLKKRKILSS